MARSKKLTEDQKILKMFHRACAQDAPECLKAHERAERNHAFVASLNDPDDPFSDQWHVAGANAEDQPRARRSASGLATLTINDIGPSVDAITGKESTQRFRPTVQAVEGGDTQAAKTDDDWIRHVRRVGGAESVESDSFRDEAITGLGWVYWAVDQRQGRTAIHRPENVDLWKMYWDTNATQRGLTDRRRQIMFKWVPEEEFLEDYPDMKDHLREVKGVPIQPGGGGRQDHGQEAPAIYMHEQAYDRDRGSVQTAYMEYKQQESFIEVRAPAGLPKSTPEEQMFQAIVQSQGGGVPWKEMSATEFEEMQKRFVEAMGAEFPPTMYAPRKRWAYKYALIGAGGANLGNEVSGRVLKKGRCPGNYWSILPMTAYPWKRRNKPTRWYSVVDRSVDAQRFANVFLSALIHHFTVLPKGSLLIDAAALDGVDMESFREDYASGGSVLPIKVSENMKSVRDIFQNLEGGTFPQATELMNLARRIVGTSMGVDPYSSGTAEGLQNLARTPASSISSVASASQSNLSVVFDGLRIYRIESGKMLLRRKYYMHTQEEIQRLVGERIQVPPQEDWTLPHDGDVLVDETAATASALEDAWQAMLNSQLLQSGLDSGHLTWRMIADMAPSFTEEVRMEIRARADQMDVLQQKEQELMQLEQELQQLAQEQGVGEAPPPQEGEPVQ